MTKWKIYNEEVVNWARHYEKQKFHALLSDCPYHLTSIVKRFGKKDSAPAKFGDDGVFQRASKGFMGSTWDGGDLAFRPETWQAFGNVLHDGAFGMAFSASRNWHRMAVAIEDAGFILHPTIFLWAYGCLSDDTEILTENGWKSYRDILVGYKVMCYNLSTKELSYMPVENIYEYDYKDTAYRIQSDFTDQLVSRNHRVIVERNGEQVFQYAETLKQQEIVPILESMQELSTTIYSSECRRVPQKESLLQTLLHRVVQTCKNWKNLETDKPASQERIASTSGEVDSLSSMRDKSMETISVVEESEDTDLFTKMQWSSTFKGISKTLLQRTFKLDRKNKTGIERKIYRGEQSVMERRSNLFSQAWELFTNQVCQVSTRIFGYGSKRWICDGASSYDSTGSWKMPYSFRSSTSQRSQSPTQLVGEPNAVSKQFGAQELRSTWIPRTTVATVTPVQYEGIVWCVKVPTGAFVARRNGKVFITGNSGFPKATRVHKQGEGRFDGSRYGLQALKPAVEPIIVFQKRFADKPRDSITRTGAGALNIDGGRIPVNGESVIINRFTDGAKPWGNGAGHEYDTESTQQGRWPSNLILTDESAERLDAQTGVLGNAWRPNRDRDNFVTPGIFGGDKLGETYKDSGGASRFFYQVSTQLDEADPAYYCAKVSPKERNAGLDEKNPHPTLKPIDLCRYLATLLLPPVEYAPRRIFVPFSGSGSEMIGAGLAGWEHVVGVEFDTENGYVDIAEKRLEHWLKD